MGLESLLASGGRPAKDAGKGDRSMNSKLWKKMRILLAKVLVVTFLINTTVYGGGTGSLAGLKLGWHDTATESNASRPAVDTASPSIPGFDAEVDYGDFDDSGYDNHRSRYQSPEIEHRVIEDLRVLDTASGHQNITANHKDHSC